VPLTIGVVLLSILLHGLSMPPLIRKLGLAASATR
jgi:NhaP-type Na+/H+ or K+/H+ antiporter